MFKRLLAAGCCAITGLVFSGCCAIAPGPCGSTCDTGVCGQGVLPTRLASRVVNRVASQCTQGCGEIYWDERINHPPVIDPCGSCGEFTGASCGVNRPILSRLRDAWGLPYIGACECASPGCDSCAGTTLSTYADHNLSSYVPAASHDPGHCASCAASAGSISSMPTATHLPSPAARTTIHNSPTPASRPTTTTDHQTPSDHAPVHSEPAQTHDHDHGHDNHSASTSTTRRIRPVSAQRPVSR